jgi:drug/metabolite transporter (DMT)-like permease
VSARALTNLVLILLIAFGWGLLGPGSKIVFAAEPSIFNGITVAVARAAWCFPVFLVGLVILWVRTPARLDRGRWLAILAGGLSFGLAITTLFSVAAQHTSVAHISFLIGISPVTNTAAAALVFRTGLAKRDRIALALGVVGVALLAISHSNDHAAFFGDALMVGWLFFFAVYACCLRYAGADVKPGLLMCVVGVISMGSLLAVGLAAGWGGGIAHVGDSARIAGWFFGEIVLGSTLIAQTAYAAAVRRMGVALATIGAEYTALTIGVITSFAFHEAWSALTVIAGLIFCCALTVTFAPLPGLGEGVGAS